MDAWERMFIDEEERDLFFIQEGMKKMNFVRIGRRVINLNTVTQVVFQPHGGASHDLQCVVICFIDSDDSMTIFQDSQPEEFRVWRTWMDEQPTLLRDEE